MIQHTKTATGLRIATDAMPHVESVTIGVYISTGARAEEIMGTAHFLEHMAFQGTTSRTAKQIQAAVENVGGFMNAETAYEYTGYYIKVLKEHWRLAVDVLSDILQNPTFPQAQMQRERGVILQEIAMYEDSPETKTVENLQYLQYQNHALGRPILGTPDTVKALRAEDLRAFMKTHYHTGNMIICAAGNLEHNVFSEYAADAFCNIPDGEKIATKAPLYHAGEHLDKKIDLQQSHVAMGWEAVHRTHDMYVPARIWSAIVGEGAVSRLYQEIREERGLVYDIDSCVNGFADCGSFMVMASTSPDDKQQVIDVSQAILQQEDFTQEELDRVKTTVTAASRMAQESSGSRMERLAQNFFVYGRMISLDEVLEKVSAVTIDDVLTAKRHILKDETFALSVVEPQ